VTVAAGLSLALASTFALNWGFFAQHGAARRLPPLSLRRPVRSLRVLFADLSWTAGFLVGIGGWVLYVAALAFAPLSLVQAVSAGGIGVLAGLARRRGDHVPRLHWAAVAVSGAGLLLLGISLAGGATRASAPTPGLLAAWLAVSAAAAGAAVLRFPWLAAGAGLGVAAGVLYGAGDAATKAATFAGGWLALVPLVLAAHGAAFVALQLGFQRGGALATAGTASLLTNALPIAAGIALFHEHPPGGLLGILRLAAFACVVAGAAALAREAPDARATPLPRDGGNALDERGAHGPGRRHERVLAHERSSRATA
jgi:hypothetical protein